ncbi:MAG TPA: DedA family protein [Candidatus Dormibacteraeota bacterium]|jgi:membrane protein DedA with SNARE-associated domain|nr:DedA family protein [Candidatus Dormibacteraeota bacterium]
MAAEPAFVRDLAPIVHRWGYLAVFGTVFLEDFGLPLPGETMLITAGVLAGLGQLSIVPLLPVAWTAAVLGDNVGYAIGLIGGRRLVLRWGRYVLVTPERLQTIEQFFGRHGGKVVLVARFLEGLRQLNGVVAGLSGMPWRRFLLFNAIGAALWVCAWGLLGDLAGAHLAAVYAALGRVELVLVIALATALLAALGVRRLRRRPPQR